MIQELSHKAASALLRRDFDELASAGKPLTQTHALDLFAKLKGYQAWSHHQQVNNKARKGRKQTPASRPIQTPIEQVLRNHFGIGGSAPSFPRRDWLHDASEGNTSLGYFQWVLNCIEGVDFDFADDVVLESLYTDPQRPVRLPNGDHTSWNLEYYLSTRTGELESISPEHKPGMAILAADCDLVGRLRSQMTEEITFLARKDGQFGLLFEQEFTSLESESGHLDPEDLVDLKPHAEVEASLMVSIAAIKAEFPGIDVCIPDPSLVIHDRPAIWCFMVDGALNEEQREALAERLFNA